MPGICPAISAGMNPSSRGLALNKNRRPKLIKRVRLKDKNIANPPKRGIGLARGNFSGEGWAKTLNRTASLLIKGVKIKERIKEKANM
jgi:hypothetical protein